MSTKRLGSIQIKMFEKKALYSILGNMENSKQMIEAHPLYLL